jgi:integrase/recombinase XerD
MARPKPKAPAGCYWRGNQLWGRAKVNGQEYRWSLQTDNPKVAAERRKAGKDRVIADKFGDAKRTFTEVLDLWADWIEAQVGPKTVKRYASSLAQLAVWLEDKTLSEIDSRLVADIIRQRTAQRVTNATIKRDLVALSSVLNFAIDQSWRDDNPALIRMRRVKEKRHLIVLPKQADIDLVIQRSPSVIGNLIRTAIATGARENELVRSLREHVDHNRKQITLIGKGHDGVEKRRAIELTPFAGYDLVSALPAFAGSPNLFWHHEGKAYTTFPQQFYRIVRTTELWARKNGISFRPFRFHDLRHLHAVNWLKDGRSIYDLQQRLGHTSLKVTERYCEFLTAEEQRIVKGLAERTENHTLSDAL